MPNRREWIYLIIMALIFPVIYFFPESLLAHDNPLFEGFKLLQWYAREHVLLCLVPAFFIAGAIGVFINQASVIRYLGPSSGKFVSYGVASVSGSVLSVCSCTVLPLFAGIYNMGAGLGPATAFLYAGPAINVMAVILTARILGWELGIARAIGAVLFSVVIGVAMQFIFRNEKNKKDAPSMVIPEDDKLPPSYRNIIYFGAMTAVLIFANWNAGSSQSGFFAYTAQYKWILTSISALILSFVLIKWYKMPAVRIAVSAAAVILSYVLFRNPLITFTVGSAALFIITGIDKKENGAWFRQTVGFMKQILPLLFAGVLVSGILLGKGGHDGIIPPSWIQNALGGNSIGSNLFASVAGALMYFATLTEIPIIEGLIGSGMGKGPALALLLAGPALSLPNMLVIRSVMGTKKTLVFVLLVMFFAALCGYIFGNFY